ncbi:hypothetical protein KAJ27_15465 [bacterium]|nr:hypothetical protein [bacterium]
MKKRLIIIFVFLFAMSIAYSKPPWAGGPKKNNWKQDKVTEIEVDEVEIDDCTDCSSCENNCYGEDEKAVKKSWKKKKKEKKEKKEKVKGWQKKWGKHPGKGRTPWSEDHPGKHKGWSKNGKTTDTVIDSDTTVTLPDTEATAENVLRDAVHKKVESVLDKLKEKLRKRNLLQTLQQNMRTDSVLTPSQADLLKYLDPQNTGKLNIDAVKSFLLGK